MQNLRQETGKAAELREGLRSKNRKFKSVFSGRKGAVGSCRKQK